MTNTNESPITVRAGNDSPRWLIRGDGVDVSLCTCRQAVYEVGNATPLLGPLAVSDTETAGEEDWFSAHLTPSQTAALNVTSENRTLTWVVELIGGVSVDPPYNREVHRRLLVLPQNLPAS